LSQSDDTGPAESIGVLSQSGIGQASQGDDDHRTASAFGPLGDQKGESAGAGYYA
jgi:hypothetical protein